VNLNITVHTSRFCVLVIFVGSVRLQPDLDEREHETKNLELRSELEHEPSTENREV
jgi:hypothetical protein